MISKCTLGKFDIFVVLLDPECLRITFAVALSDFYENKKLVSSTGTLNPSDQRHVYSCSPWIVFCLSRKAFQLLHKCCSIRYCNSYRAVHCQNHAKWMRLKSRIASTKSYCEILPTKLMASKVHKILDDQIPEHTQELAYCTLQGFRLILRPGSRR